MHGSPSATALAGGAYNDGTELRYSVGWTAVLFRNIGGIKRGWDSAVQVDLAHVKLGVFRTCRHIYGMAMLICNY